MRRLYVFAAAVFLGAASMACGGGSESQAEEVPPDQIAATVNGEVITLPDVMKVAGNFAKQGMQPDPASQGDTYEERLYYTVVDRLVEQQLVAQKAEELGLEVTPDRIAASVSQLKTMAGGEEAYTKLLADNGITAEDIEHDTRMNLLMKEYYDQVVPASPEISQEEIQDYFAKNPQLFGPQQEVHARHILFRADPGADDMTLGTVVQKAQAALEQAKTQDFAALAKEVSEDETTRNAGGDLGWFGKGRMVAPFDSAAFALKPGQISGLVRTQFGYHILKVEDTRMSEPKSLEQVQGQIRQVVAQEKSQKLFQDQLDSLREAANLEVKPPSTKTLAALSS